MFSRVPAYLNVVDIAGLVRGANEGKGLGNAFLSHVRAVDAMFEMVRIFESEEVTHVDGEVDAVRDLETIADELRLKDLEYVRKEHEHTEKLALRAGDKQKKFEAVGYYLELWSRLLSYSTSTLDFVLLMYIL